MFDAGMVQICTLQNIAEPGEMPKEALSQVSAAMFEERTVGYNRFYASKGVNEQVDLLIRVWRNNTARIGMYAVLTCSENDGQYRILNVQHMLDDDGLKVTDLTLQRMGRMYEINPNDD